MLSQDGTWQESGMKCVGIFQSNLCAGCTLYTVLENRTRCCSQNSLRWVSIQHSAKPENKTSPAQETAATRGGQRGALQFSVSVPYSGTPQESNPPG
eukprot:COSAG02_NODE_1696_length_11261_cov_132.993639_5_plen_97_part_00